MEKIKWRYYLIPLLIWPLLFAISCQKEDIRQKAEEEEDKDYIDALIDVDQGSKDARRARDVANIQAALELYFLENEHYPKSLEKLAEEGYLPHVPRDPEPDEHEYTYTPIGAEPANYYDLIFWQEKGVAEYEKGENVVNP